MDVSDNMRLWIGGIDRIYRNNVGFTLTGYSVIEWLELDFVTDAVVQADGTVTAYGGKFGPHTFKRL